MVPTFIPCTLAEAMLAVEVQKSTYATARSVNPHRPAVVAGTHPRGSNGSAENGDYLALQFDHTVFMMPSFIPYTLSEGMVTVRNTEDHSGRHLER